MSITEKEPVVEQPSDDIKIEDSEESASESPTTSSSHAEKNNQNNNKVDIDYLDSNLFSKIKEVSPEELNSEDSVLAVSEEESKG